jgi:hypothetical protein
MDLCLTRGMLDEHYQPLQQDPGDENNYTLGRIGVHNVVLASEPAPTISLISLRKASGCQVVLLLKPGKATAETSFLTGPCGGAPIGQHSMPEAVKRLTLGVVEAPGHTEAKH